ncbi:MAG TPA: outer membrane protein assembly factor BamA [Nitrospinota bacterium]|nr:outer membrane protein assembly factor BamA [Nitrospinota bacterium]
MRIKHKPLLMFICLWSFLFFVNAASAEREVLKIKEIEIKGNFKVEESTIRFHIKSKVGDRFSVNQLRDDLKKIYNLGFFKDVKIDVQDFEGGLKIIFVVSEKSSIGNIIISGNEKIKEDDIRKELTIKENTIINKNLIKESIEKIKILYQTKRFLFADVESYVKEIDANRVDLEIKIDEGLKMSVDKIAFSGNKSFDEKTLRKVMLIKEENLFSFITKKGTYVEEVLKNDISLIENFYSNKGYIMAKAGEPRVEINRSKGKIYVTIPIIEGEEFSVGKVSFRGDPDLSEEEMYKKLSLREGYTFSRSILREDINLLTELYAKKGYALVDIAPSTKTDLEKKVVNVVYNIDKRKRMFVGNINVLGNLKTRDNVIRRGFELSEGEVFDSEKLRKSKRALDFSGFFSDVEIDTTRSEKDDIIDIETRVKEMDTGVISFGGGYSSVENMIFGGSVAQNNLFGRGHKLQFATYLSGVTTQFKINFENPALFDSSIGFNSNLFNLKRDYLYFNQDSQGGGFGFSKELRENVTGTIHYKLEDVEVSNIDPGITSSYIRSQEGTTMTSSIMPAIVRDTRDRRFAPTRGSRTFFSTEFAGGPLGGNNEFYRAIVGTRKYIPVWKKKRLVFGQFVQGGFAQGLGGEELPIFERFFAGGSGTIRGFTYNEVGPQEGGEAVGGDSRFLWSSELRYPLVNQMNITGIGFLDAGNVYSDIKDFDPFNLRSAIGAGIRLFTPIGPMGFDYGIKLDQKPGESPGEFHFKMGAGAL